MSYIRTSYPIKIWSSIHLYSHHPDGSEQEPGKDRVKVWILKGSRLHSKSISTQFSLLFQKKSMRAKIHSIWNFELVWTRWKMHQSTWLWWLLLNSEPSATITACCSHWDPVFFISPMIWATYQNRTRPKPALCYKKKRKEKKRREDMTLACRVWGSHMLCLGSRKSQCLHAYTGLTINI